MVSREQELRRHLAARVAVNELFIRWDHSDDLDAMELAAARLADRFDRTSELRWRFGAELLGVYVGLRRSKARKKAGWWARLQSGPSLSRWDLVAYFRRAGQSYDEAQKSAEPIWADWDVEHFLWGWPDALRDCTAEQIPSLLPG